MSLPDKNFTITLSPLPPDFFQTYGPATAIARAVDSRYWETRISDISVDLAQEICVSITTDDIEGDSLWH